MILFGRPHIALNMFQLAAEKDQVQVNQLFRLTVVNAIQLAMAIVANVLLLLNLARKVRFTIAQPVTIVTW